jgi:DHA3 family macrolide efflux protein-like MFS transporter
MQQGSWEMNTLQKTQKGPSGMTGFTIVWLGQLVSVLATNMSGFGLTIWAFQLTGSATVLGIVQLSFSLPFLLISPFAGAMVDRYNRKLMMMVSDLGAVLATTAVLVLNLSGELQIWHLYIANAVFGLSNSFQWPAYSAAISTMVAKSQYDRANGMMSLVESGPAVFSPILAGALLPLISLTGILIIDVVTFFLAIGVLIIVHVPQPTLTEEGQAGKGSLLQEAFYGFKYIFARRSLLSLLLIILCLNLTGGFSQSLTAPMILLRTKNNSAVLGMVESAFAIGGVAGGLIVSAWGGFKKRIRGMLFGWSVYALLGLILFGIGRNLYIWIPVAALSAVTFPLTQSASNAIWQAKVAPDIQGRVFSARRLIAWLVDPIMPVLSGFVADYALEPSMQAKTGLASFFGWLAGNEPGSGMSVQFVISGLLYLMVIVVAWFIPAVRNVESILPDHDKLKKVEAAVETAG